MNDPAKMLELLEALKRSYLAELPVRIDDLESLALAIKPGANFNEQYTELYRHTHSLKGSGGTYGFGVITSICHRLEDHLQLVNGDSDRFGEDDRRCWLAHVDVLRHAVELLRTNADGMSEVERELDAIRADVFTRNARVMVVEKSKSTVLYCRQVLASLPVQVVVTEDGLQALDRLLQEKFDLLISGLEVDKLNGLAMLAALRLSNGPNRAIKSIIITSKPQRDMASHFRPDWVLRRDETLGDRLLESTKLALTLH